jgi:hypothetical protein
MIFGNTFLWIPQSQWVFERKTAPLGLSTPSFQKGNETGNKIEGMVVDDQGLSQCRSVPNGPELSQARSRSGNDVLGTDAI